MKKIAFIMDPFENLAPHRDNTLMMIEAALKRSLDVYFFEPTQMLLEGNQPFAHATQVLFCDVFQPENRYIFGDTRRMSLSEFDLVVIRKDPPFDMDYIFMTYLLDLAVMAGVRVVSSPQAIRNFNEKMVILRFPDLIAPTLVSAHKSDIKRFWQQHGEIILKPLDGLGGHNIFHVKAGDTNFSTMVEMLTQNGKRQIMIQRYLPEVREGDKRIILLHGEAIPLALARIPNTGEIRASLSSGSGYKVQALTERDLFLCQQVAPLLKEHDIPFAGLDVIGDYITEINITSPSCMRELSEGYGQNLAEIFLNGLLK